ncbi:MAG: PIG-L deacetylase family protein [Chloroflexota bacterium]|nr:PIG-L deacetylase family protein [Chloroflexota bacterium]
MEILKGEVTIERAARGKPHRGKVLAVSAPHSDDVPFFCGGAVAKLIQEGYTGNLIRVTNDEKDSYGITMGETVLGNERDTREVARILGLKQVFDLNYRNHRVDDVPRTEFRGRLILLFRLLKVDTVFSFDPWGHYEENPDHYVTAQMVEAACWMAGCRMDLPEQQAAGLKPHAVSEKYYWARGPQFVNRVVDIAPYIDLKMKAGCANKTQIGHMVHSLKERLAAQGKKLPILEADDETAIRQFLEVFLVGEAANVGQAYGLEHAEQFHYIGPDPSIAEYVDKHAVPLK